MTQTHIAKINYSQNMHKTLLYVFSVWQKKSRIIVNFSLVNKSNDWYEVIRKASLMSIFKKVFISYRDHGLATAFLS